LTKYNVGAALWQRPAAVAAAGQPVVLVPGQVETDASLRLGAPSVRTNLELLKSVRAARPQAWLVYKPHPDVVAGLRNKGHGEDDASKWCDEIVTDAGMGPLLGAVDEVHVLTSLAGFEALLRGKKVVCHGVPFYAGWGLTEDAVAVARRTRRVNLDELVAATLIVYPSYVSRATRQACSVEQALSELLAWKTGSEDAVPWWRRLLRPWIRHK
jgi:capsular polysaccharide export protein